MSLINKLDTTKLKSLKFGGDTPGGGNSGEPYIQNNIPREGKVNFDDGLIRGGMVKALDHSLKDTLRIGKFLTDIPKGPLFISKQIGLQLSNPKLETIKLNEGKGIGGFINQLSNIISDKVGIGPTRIYNAGVNTLAQISLTAFGQHIVRHGLTPIHNIFTNYENVVKKNNTVNYINDEIVSNNRLISLKKKLNLLESRSPIKLFGVPVAFGYKEDIENVIDSYWGGPNSTYGIGNTIISRYNNTSDIKTKNNLLNQYRDNLENQLSNINYFSTQGASLYYFEGNQTYKPDALLIHNDLDEDNPNKAPKNLNGNKSIDYIQTSLVTQMKNRIFKSSNNSNEELGSTSFQRDENGNLINLNINISYSKNNINYINSYGEEINLGKSWSDYNRETRIGSGRKDSINRIPLIYDSKPLGKINIPNVGILSTRDMVKFRIEAIDTDNINNSTWMYFRSYLKSFSDSYSSDIQKHKYMGRGESFLRYNGFEREISFTFKVAALSREEMEPMYQKLNYLASNLTPDYSSQGLMRGPLMKLTIGNYIYREPGMIRSLTYNISDETPWEIALDEPEGGYMMYELPHIIDINISYIPIHNFLPQKSISNSPFILNKPEEEITGFGAERINNPWLRQKNNNNIYINNPLTSINSNGQYTEFTK